MKAAIFVDDWKLPVFRKRLKKAGFTYEDAGAAYPGTTALTVHTDDMLKLKAELERCQAECAKKGRG